MNRDEAEQLENLFDNGFLILITSRFVDSPVRAIYDNSDEEPGIGLVYCSEVFSDMPLNEVDVSDVQVYCPADEWSHNKTSIDNEQYENWKIYKTSWSDRQSLKTL